MLALLSLLLATPERPPLEAVCEVERAPAVSDDPLVAPGTRYTVTCPRDVPSPDSLVTHALDLAPTAFVPFAEGGVRYGQPTLYFYWNNGRWTPPRDIPQRFQPRYPRPAARQGVVAVCRVWSEVTAEGEPLDPRVACDSGPRRNGEARFIRDFERRSVQAIGSWDYDPAAEPSVEQACFHFQLGSGALSEVEDPPCRIPDYLLAPRPVE